ncbi:MAG: IS30 family transposase [bacterium]
MKHLTSYEREQIAYWKSQGLGVRDIAGKVSRDHSVVSRELRRNKGQLFPYEAANAQYYAERRRRIANRPKLSKHRELKEWVHDQLMQKWSPEQIAGRLKEHPPVHLAGLTISHEAIYQWIYAESPRGAPWLYHHLRRKHVERRPKFGRKKRNQVKIPELVPISERGELEGFGHFEADSVVGKNHKPGLSVHYEKATQWTKLHKLESMKAEETLAALEGTLADLPLGFAASVTFDRGGETALHYRLRESYGVATYHCDPYSPHQKGGVENVNGLVRQFFPKGTDFRYVSPETVALVEDLLNNRPRKKLNYQTPNEAMSGALDS